MALPGHLTVDNWRTQFREFESRINLLREEILRYENAITSEDESKVENLRYTVGFIDDETISVLMHLADIVRYTGRLAYDIELVEVKHD